MAIPPGSLQVQFDFQNPSCFNGSGTILTDLSPNGNDFTLNNTSYTYNSTLGALTLPSGTYADGIAANFVFGTNPVTISAWVKMNTSVPGINVCYFGGSGAGTRTQFLWRSSDNLIVVDNASSAGAWDFTADNQWHLLTITRPANSLVNQQIVYLDGVLIPLSASTFNPLQPLNGSLGSARIHDSSDTLEIATFEVYDAQLSAGDVLTLYNDTKDRFIGLVSHIDLLDPACYSGTGNTITDLANPAASWNITGSKTYDGSVGAITWGASTIIELDTQLAATGNIGRTLAAWIKWPQDGPINPGEGVQPFLQIGDDTNYNGFSLTMASNTEIGGRFPIMLIGDSYNSNVTAVAYSPAWTFVAMTLPAGQIGVNGTIYLNGVSVGTLGYNVPGSPPNITYSSGQFGIYNHDYSPYGTQSSGTVSQHWIYDAVLDAADILALYNDTVTRYYPTPPSSNGVGGRQFAQGFNG